MNASLSGAGCRHASRGRSSRRAATAVVMIAAFQLSAIGPALAQPAASAPQAPTAPPAPSAQPAPAGARVLSLDDAIALAQAGNEQVAIAQAGATRAVGNQLRVRSEKKPQLTGSASYDRALQSEFSGLFDSTGPACTPLTVNPSAPLGDRVAEIERALIDCPPSSNVFGGGDSGDDSNALPFGRKNTYRLGLVFSQVLFTGGRIAAQERQAALAKSNADLNITATGAQLQLDVTQAFYDAALADRLVLIAGESYAQADRAFQQTKAQRDAGRVSEFEQLRAQVSRDTLQPDVVRQRAMRDVAYLRLKQLINLPLDAPIQLAANLEDETLAPPPSYASPLAEAEASLKAAAERIAITQVQNDLRSQEAAVDVARAQRKPTIALNSNFGLVAYPTTAPAFDDWRRNWTIGASLSLPIFTGGRIAADEAIAKAGVVEQQARLSLTRELADLDVASARAELAAALAAWQASAGTIQQATRAYEIAELRYREGLSTQLELSDSRLLLAQAQVNRATAARTLQLARVRFALLPRLPLSATSGAGAAGASSAAPAATPTGGGQSGSTPTTGSSGA
jgi:outer membrane protein TolC